MMLSGLELRQSMTAKNGFFSYYICGRRDWCGATTLGIYSEHAAESGRVTLTAAGMRDPDLGGEGQDLAYQQPVFVLQSRHL